MWGIIAGKSLAVVAVVFLQSILLGAIGFALGWRPHIAGLVLGAVIIALGTAGFAALGLLLGGTLRAEIVLAVANLLWFVFAGLGALTLEGGMVPHGVEWVARLDPVGRADRGAVAGDDAVGGLVRPRGARGVGRASPRCARCAGSASPTTSANRQSGSGHETLVLRAKLISAPDSPTTACSCGPLRSGACPSDDSSCGWSTCCPMPSLRVQRIIAAAVILTQGGIAVTGAIVRVTASGLGCPTWPQCFPGSFTPVPRRRGAGASTRPSSSATA